MEEGADVKRFMSVMLLGLMSMTTIGCKAATTTTNAAVDRIVGVWIIPVGPSIPPYYTDFNDPWALKFYLNPDQDQVGAFVGGSPFYDLSLDLRSFLDDRGVSTNGLRLRGALGVRAEGNTFGFAWIYRNAANILYPGDQYGYYFDEPSDLETISVLQILASMAIEIEFRFVAMPQIDSLTVSFFTANHEWIETATVVLTNLAPWSVEADASAAYAVVEETFAGGEVQRTIYSNREGQTTHTVFVFEPYGFAAPCECRIIWTE